MLRLFSPRFVVALLVAAVALPVVVRGQSQSSSQDSQTDSVAEAARKAREQKKASDKAAPVITDDILKPSRSTAPAANGDTSANAQAAPADANAAAASDGKTSGAENPGDKGKAEAALNDLKQQIAEAEKSLDIVKRELTLEQDNVYSKTDYSNDEAGKTKLDELMHQVSDKQQTVDDLKAKLAEIQSKADEQPPASPEPPSPPSPPSPEI